MNDEHLFPIAGFIGNDDEGFILVHATGLIDINAQPEGATPAQALDAVRSEGRVYSERELARQRAEEEAEGEGGAVATGYACGGGFASAPPSKPKNDRYGGVRTYADFTGADPRRVNQQYRNLEEGRNREPIMSGSDGAVKPVDNGEPIVLKPVPPTGAVKGVVGINPKELVGSKKPDLSVVPPVALLHLATAMMNGADKYGPFNWRDQPIRMRPYLAAMMRHAASCLDGEDFSQDTVEAGLPVHHLAHVMACCAIVLDAIHCGTITDDRPQVPGSTGDAIEHYNKEKKLLVKAAA